MSGVPQGSVLGPILFTIFVDDLEENVKSRMIKFADDAKLWGKVGKPEDINVIQYDLTTLFQWSVDWQMLFNVEKCKVMHIGSNNLKVDYVLDGIKLGVIEEEKDLGVFLCSDFKVGKQCRTAASKGNQILGMIRRNFTNRSKRIMSILYKSLVRPHLEYCIQAWRPHLVKDITLLERVQRRATKMVSECRGKDYEKRLKIMRLTKLDTRMSRADMIEVYKILNGLERVREELFFIRERREGRGHKNKLFKKRVQRDVGKFCFSNRINNMWNGLPEDVVMAKDVNGFKSGLDLYLGEIGDLNKFL
jgi:ribonucleases P/MRP protein subunit RPP40